MSELNLSYRIGSRWWNKRTWCSHPPTNISKVDLPVEHFSQKTIFRLKELLYKYKHKKDFHITYRMESSHKIRCFWETYKKERKPKTGELSPWGTKESSQRMGVPAWGPSWRGKAHWFLGVLPTQSAWLRSLDSVLKEYTGATCLQTVRRSSTLAAFTSPCTRIQAR